MRRAVISVVVLLSVVSATPALAHSERDIPAPARSGPVPDQTRTPSQVIDVCKTGECPFQHIQAAVDAASNGALIQIWPGTYKEEPSRSAPDKPADNADGTYSYEFHVANPNAQSLIAIIGKKDITLRGMGVTPRDVVIDAAFEKDVVIRGDRADGLIIENMSVWHGYEHGVYVLDTDGFVIDRVDSGYSREYGFLMFATDYGLIKNCNAFGAGDAGIYPGGTAEPAGRFSTEVRDCKSYGNVLGYSGTQGNHVLVRGTEFFNNAVGLVSDSETDHPNYPQKNLVFENNKVYDNNFNPYLESSNVKATVFANFAYIPVGTGVFLLSGNENKIRSNQIYNNDRYGLWLGSGYGLVLGPTGPVTTGEDPVPPWLSSKLRISNNYFNSAQGGAENGIDIAWDGLGEGTCFESNWRGKDVPATTDAAYLPQCDIPVYRQPMPTTLGLPTASNFLAQLSLVFVEGEPLCYRMGQCEWGPGPAPEDARNLPEGYQPPADPVACGPKSCDKTRKKDSPHNRT